jgi:hypothetical protein
MTLFPPVDREGERIGVIWWIFILSLSGEYIQACILGGQEGSPRDMIGD